MKSPMKKETYETATELLEKIDNLETHIHFISKESHGQNLTYNAPELFIVPDGVDASRRRQLKSDLLPFEPRQFMRLYLLNCRERLEQLKTEFENLK